MGNFFIKTKKKDVPAEIVKQDMLGCGFDNTFNNIDMYFNDRKNYVKAQLCMENKGCKDTLLPKGVCHRYPDGSPYQARQKKIPNEPDWMNLKDFLFKCRNSYITPFFPPCHIASTNHHLFDGGFDS